MNAKSELAGSINTKIKEVMDQYTNQRKVADKTDFENKFEKETRSVVEQSLSGITMAGEKLFKETDGSYSYWVVIEVSKNLYLKL